MAQREKRTWIRLLIVTAAAALVVLAVLLLLALRQENEPAPELVDEIATDHPASPEVPPEPREAPQPPPVERPPPPPPTAAASADRTRQLMEHVKRGVDPFSLDEPYDGPPINAEVKGAPMDTIDPDVWGNLQHAVPLITRCYKKRLQKKPGIAGSVSLTFAFVRDGNHATIPGAEVVSSTLKDFALESCVLRALARLRLPAGLADNKRKWAYSFTLATK
jgi:hypothetical protein